MTVYQFNPLDYTFGDDCTQLFPPPLCSYTNDASLLLPVNAWTRSYVAASYPPQMIEGAFPSLITISSSRDGTQVTVTPRAAVDGGDGVGALPAGMPSTLALNAGDAVQLFSTTGDLTGSKNRVERAGAGHRRALLYNRPPGHPVLRPSRGVDVPARGARRRVRGDRPGGAELPDGRVPGGADRRDGAEHDAQLSTVPGGGHGAQ